MKRRADHKAEKAAAAATAAAAGAEEEVDEDEEEELEEGELPAARDPTSEATAKALHCRDVSQRLRQQIIAAANALMVKVHGPRGGGPLQLGLAWQSGGPGTAARANPR